MTAFADAFLPYEPIGISEIDADRYLKGCRQGDTCALGRAELDCNATDCEAAVSATCGLTVGRLAINTGLARTELPVIATAESEAATVFSQEFRTTGFLLDLQAGILADGRDQRWG
jgi:hypothetical protein